MESGQTPQPLEQSAFPRTCESCQRVYQSEQAFFRDTSPVASIDDKAQTSIKVTGENGGYLEVTRRCQCGASLTERFHSRRELTDEGLRNRATFEDLLQAVEEGGVERAEARTMLLDFLAGDSEQE